MASPYEPAAEILQPDTRKSRWFLILRAMLVGAGVTGLVLGALRFVVVMPLPIAARCEMLGGAMSLAAGTALFVLLSRARYARAEVLKLSVLFASFFLFLGSVFFVHGYSTESFIKARYNATESNLKQLKRALENYNTGGRRGH